MATHTESYEARRRYNSEERVAKDRTVWQCNYGDGKFSDLITGRVR